MEDGLPPIVQGIKSGDTKIVNLQQQHGAVLLELYKSSSRFVFSLSAAPNSGMCTHLHDNGINDWHQKKIISIQGHFIPGLSRIEATKWHPPDRITRYRSVGIKNVTPLHMASFRGSKEALQYAMEFGNDMDVNIAASFGATPLFFAVYGGKDDIVEFLVSLGANLNDLYGPCKWSPLHLAAAIGNKAVVEILMRYGADIQARDSIGMTPARLALDRKHKHIASILNERWAKLLPSSRIHSASDTLDLDVKIVKDDRSVSAAIEDAILRRDLSTLKYLLQNGDSIKGSCSCGCSPLLMALNSGRKRMYHFLIDAGASLEGVVACPVPMPTSGYTPLHFTALYGDEQPVEKILKAGQSYQAQGVYLLQLAVCNGHSACVRVRVMTSMENAMSTRKQA
ncbi:hypothetical protein DSL72_008682 [Monilinia vaccinii-corymbosi]|uniref:Uncharacterized protein n=1 Tax=Monilinia vaccinii-corymbosi TaxID=61207 RepID=A0A8A3PRS6_9HELO|nr:hypothetical protein DSL72_008682 [Monilinia vaccinii-corymbosi]